MYLFYNTEHALELEYQLHTQFTINPMDLNSALLGKTEFRTLLKMDLAKLSEIITKHKETNGPNNSAAECSWFNSIT